MKKVTRRLWLLDADVDRNRAKWECSDCGYTWRGVMFLGKSAKINRSIKVKMISYWSRENGGVRSICPKCTRERHGIKHPFKERIT